MKKNFYFTCVLTLFSFLGINATAQTPHVDFTYDAAGNRVLRQYSALKVMNSDTTKHDPEAEQIAAQYGIGVYPNPLMDGNNVTVAVSSAKNTEGEQATVYVLDNIGKILFSQKQNTSSPSLIDLSGYAAGIYYIKVAIKKEQLFYKITKTK